MPFAVIDFETTGLIPEKHDRAIEVGIVLTDDHGRVEHEWTTLLNPRRDVGAARVHGIRAADLLDAPEFGDVADHVLDLVSGRTVVAHNAIFDMRFLLAELRRASFDMPHPPAALCSMKWAGRAIGAAKLQHCCEALGIDLVDAHTALADARATAALLAHLQDMIGTHPEWGHDVNSSARYAWPATRPDAPPVRSVLRGQATSDPYAWLRSVLEAAWVPGDPENEAAYLLVLDQALLDRHISVTEGRELAATAEAAGLSRETVNRLHHDYLRSVALEALADNVVTPDERADLESVASALGLGVPYVEEALSWASRQEPADIQRDAFALNPGDRVVFTGEMTTPRDQWVKDIAAAGLASGGVTKSTKLVVAADPDSMSGKAAKARQYGVPVIGEEAFARLFEAYVREGR